MITHTVVYVTPTKYRELIRGIFEAWNRRSVYFLKEVNQQIKSLSVTAGVTFNKEI
jgi:hypothetical protein